MQQALIVAEHTLSLGERAQRRADVLLVGVSESGSIVGFVEAALPVAPNADHRVTSLAVDAMMRRQGVGEALMRAVEQVLREQAKMLGTPQLNITLEVEDTNS
eukprot:CAMPEP_0174751178 /NCGR_PEP_ID=MMETSP1094-20130205/99267_1 /TAXON_ID=156173 /ORGANISM="Chrysochromulina brevifilum, Strain UTEX LB 985" /LENGTH=102 /DNA_ID=CAMNT_0015956627 /DNA_START=8 /DNA_END=312 /DNA_ORIENTATION=-